MPQLFFHQIRLYRPHDSRPKDEPILCHLGPSPSQLRPFDHEICLLKNFLSFFLWKKPKKFAKKVRVVNGAIILIWKVQKVCKKVFRVVHESSNFLFFKKRKKFEKVYIFIFIFIFIYFCTYFCRSAFQPSSAHPKNW